MWIERLQDAWMISQSIIIRNPLKLMYFKPASHTSREELCAMAMVFLHINSTDLSVDCSKSVPQMLGEILYPDLMQMDDYVLQLRQHSSTKASLWPWIQTQSINHLLTACFHSPGSPCTSFSTPRYVGGSGCHNCRVLQAVLVILGKKPSFFLWKEWKFLRYIAVEKSGNEVWNQEMKSGMWNAETDLVMTPSQQNKVWKFNHAAAFFASLKVSFELFNLLEKNVVMPPRWIRAHQP